MKKKGFTLIELLAVIVILAIIAIIATPMILGVIETTKKGALESSALGYIDAVEKQIAINELDTTKDNIGDGVYVVGEIEVTLKGNGPEEGWIYIEKGQVVEYSLKFEEYIVNDSEKEAIKNGTLKEQPTGEYTSYKVGDSVTIDGIGYHVIKSSSTTNEYVMLLRDESIGQMAFDENGGVDYETSTLKNYLDTTYKETFGEKQSFIKEITLIDFGTVTQTGSGAEAVYNISGEEGTYGYIVNNFEDISWLTNNFYYSLTPSELVWSCKEFDSNKECINKIYDYFFARMDKNGYFYAVDSTGKNGTSTQYGAGAISGTSFNYIRPVVIISKKAID